MTSAWDTLENLGFNNKKKVLTQEKEKKRKDPISFRLSFEICSTTPEIYNFNAATKLARRLSNGIVIRSCYRYCKQKNTKASFDNSLKSMASLMRIQTDKTT